VLFTPSRLTIASALTHPCTTFSHLEHGTAMPAINELKDKIITKTLNMVLLSIATLGLYLL
jgi:hypothetical protein